MVSDASWFVLIFNNICVNPETGHWTHTALSDIFYFIIYYCARIKYTYTMHTSLDV